MDWSYYKDYLLRVIPGSKLVSGGTTINCRCRECPDSSNPDSAHMYISIPKNADEPSLYYCHKCGCKGIVTHNTLIRWGIYDVQVANELTMYNSKISKKSSNSKYFNKQVYDLRNTYTTIDQKSEIKLKYIQDRLGVGLSYEDLHRLKICLNLNDLIKENHINKLTRVENIVNQLDQEFIGFISIDNVFLNMRKATNASVYKEIDKRYVNYRIFDKSDDSTKFYTIPTQVNLNGTKRVKLHIAEGPFDILSVYLNCRNMEEGIYTSVTGNRYDSVINFFLTNFMLPYIELHIYPDNDKYGSMQRMRSLKYHLLDPSIPIYVHMNTYSDEKDFGVPKSRISESIIQL